jgi:hypothetical protein
LGSSERFENAITDYALQYADLNVGDYSQLMTAIDDGSVSALKEM